MAKQSLKHQQVSYFGKAGHLYLMSELLLRGWNVAIPEVDEGDDILVVRNKENQLIRVQVKSANLALNNKAAFKVKKSDVDGTDRKEYDFVHVFLIRQSGKSWLLPIVIPQDKLITLYARRQVSSKIIAEDAFYVSMTFELDILTSIFSYSKQDLTEFTGLNNSIFIDYFPTL